MYIWEIEAIVKWTYHETVDDADNDGASTFTIAARDYRHAIEKLGKIALAPSKGFDEINDETQKMVKHRPLEIVGIVKIVRGVWIDGCDGC